MEPISWLIYAAAVFAGSYVQSVAGFAMGMIVIAVCGAEGSIPVPELAATVSLISFANIIFAIEGRVALVDRALIGWLTVGQLPAIAIGIWLLTVLDKNAQWTLQLLLGIFIASGSLSMIIRPVRYTKRSSPAACLAAGIGGGIFGGMFSASGPIIAWFAYRQPLEIGVIRATILTYFAVSTVTRSAIVGVQGGLTEHVMHLVLVALPIVLVSSWLGKTLPPAIPDATLKRIIFSLLLLMGLTIVLRVVF
ncbi:MAG: putative membrane protein YfcA [Gammaproteobacteria bacterium]|jgi:uncharacterized membrane protein YfcA